LVPDSFVAIFYFLDNIAKSPANEIDSFADALAPSGFETPLGNLQLFIPAILNILILNRVF